MEFFKPGRTLDFMRYRNQMVAVSLLMVAASIVSMFVPGPNFGIDFSGGTEVQLQMRGDVGTAELRQSLSELGFESPDVIAVQGQDNQYIVRVREVSTLPEGIEDSIREQLQSALGGTTEVLALRVSPGGDKVSLRLDGAADLAQLESALTAAGVEVRGHVTRFGPENDYRYEANLVGVADRMVHQLQERLGERGPEPALRIEWVGPRAGEQLRNAALQALLYAIAFIMVYVAFRFDLRFAPGGILALLHDAIITIGVLVLVQKEFNLTTIASLLAIIGYSINDTIVVYDRIRENMARHRGKSMRELINISTSEMLGRTLITSGTTIISMLAFFVWGTPVIRDIAFALVVGITIGTYSSIYIAAPMTEVIDTYVFRRARDAAQAGGGGRKGGGRRAASARA
jgi:preprotein translocase subunit SecF